MFMSRFSCVDVVYQGIYESVLFHSVQKYKQPIRLNVSYRVFMLMESVVYDHEHYKGPD